MSRLREGVQLYRDGMDYMHQYVTEFEQPSDTQNEDFFELLELGNLVMDGDNDSPPLIEAISTWRDRLSSFRDFYPPQEEIDEQREPSYEGKLKKRSSKKTRRSTSKKSRLSSKKRRSNRKN